MQSFEEWDQSDSFEIRESESAPSSSHCSSLHVRDMAGLGMMQRNVLGLCTIHRGRYSINDIARELGRSPSEIARIVNRLEDRGLLNGMIPTRSR